MRIARHHIALRLLVNVSVLIGLFLVCGACYLALNRTAVFQNSPQQFRREEDVYTPILLGIMVSALFFGGSVANRFLLNRYTLTPDYLEMEDFLTGRCTRIRPEEVATVEQFAIMGLNPVFSFARGWKIISQSGKHIPMSEQLPLWLEIAKRFPPDDDDDSSPIP